MTLRRSVHMKIVRQDQTNQEYSDCKKFNVSLILMLMLLCFSNGHAEEASSVPVYRSAPAPEKLANDLFKPRYRAVIINDEVKQQKTENLFAMMINFEFDSIRILPRSYPLLDSVGKMLGLAEVKNKRIIIEGHTDALGRDEYNQVLSERRALAIKRYLVSRYAVQADRLVIIGKGESDLYNKRNPSDEINRRVQFRPLS